MLRFPDGEQVTFDGNADAIEGALQGLRPGPAASALGGLPAIPAASGAVDGDGDEIDRVRADLVDFLDKRGAISRVDAGGDDWFLSHLGYVEAAAVESRRVSKRVSLRGSGWLHEMVAEALAPIVPCAEGEERDSPDTLVVATSDWNDLELFRRENARAVRAKQPITFIARTDSEIVTGPFVVPGETACFECYHRRLEYNVNFPAEFAAYARVVTERAGSGERAESTIARGLAEFLVRRHVLAATKRLSAILEPGVILSFDCMFLRVRRTPVLKVPRCGICGRRVEKPRRTIRDLA